jgi:hypothetical protein
MKKTTTLLVIVLAITALFNLKAQTDFTNLIANPSFESGDLTGWTWTGTAGYAWLGPNTDGDATKDGSYICGIWNSPIGDAECSQSITGLSNGYYRVTALATVSTNRTTTQRLFANNKSTLYGASNNPAYSVANLDTLGKTEIYSFGGYAESTAENGPFKKLSVVLQVTDGNLTFGFRVNGKANTLGYDFSYSPKDDAGFFKFDNFTLTEVSEVLNLANITLSVGTLSPAFHTDSTEYTAILPVGTTTVTPTATISIDGQTVSGTEAVDVSSGSGVSTITVTAFDGVSTGVYTITYKVLTLSNDASLSALSTSAGSLFPAFDANITTYKVLLPIGTASVTPTATKNDAKATVTGDSEVTLANGIGTSTITVTAEDGTVKTYTLNYDYDYITNPSFETGDFTGWTWLGSDGYTWMGVNTDGDDTKNGSYVAGTWNATFGDVELSQTITGLPNAVYTVTADLMGSGNGTTSRLTTQRLFANGKCMLFGSETSYSPENLTILGTTETYSFGDYTETQSDIGPFLKLAVTTTVTDGTLALGIRTNGISSFWGYTFPNLTAGDGHGWFKVDNFTMSYAGPLTEIAKIAKTQNKASYVVIDGKLMVKGAESFVVYNLQGIKVADVPQNASNTMISLKKGGIYIVITEKNEAFKVLLQ